MKNSNFWTSVVDSPSAAIAGCLAAARSAMETSITAAARAERQVNGQDVEDAAPPSALVDPNRAWVPPASARDHHA